MKALAMGWLSPTAKLIERDGRLSKIESQVNEGPRVKFLFGDIGYETTTLH